MGREEILRMLSMCILLDGGVHSHAYQILGDTIYCFAKSMIILQAASVLILR